MQNYHLSRQGFTLIELSIVLVVIGLLIGGILIGQSLVDSAKINAQVKQFQQYDIAVQNYVLKYRKLPRANSAGYLRYDNGSNACTGLTGDCHYIFSDLYRYGTLGEAHNYLVQSWPWNGNGSTPMFGVGYSHPISKIDSKIGITVAQATNKKLWWQLFCNSGNLNMSCSGTGRTGLSVGQARALDAKIDDGNGFRGTVATMAMGPYASGCIPGGYGGNQTFWCGNPLADDPHNFGMAFDTTGTCVNATTGVYLSNPSTTTTCYMQVKSNANY